MRKPTHFSAIAFVLFSMSMPAMAYIGPGLGAGTIGVVVGVIGSIFLALFAIVYYPIKRMIKNRKAPAASKTDIEKFDTSGEVEGESVGNGDPVESGGDKG